MPSYKVLRVKVPPHLRINVITPKCLGDTPAAAILRPKNLAPPASVTKTGDKQYSIVFEASCANETVDLALTSAAFSFIGFLKGLFLAFFFFLNINFWKSLLPGGGFWSSFSLKTFLVRSFVVSGLLFVCLVGLEVSGVKIHKPFSGWLNTLTMAEISGDKLREIIGFDKQDKFFTSKEAYEFHARTGKKLDEVYLMTYVVEDDQKYRLLVRKNFLAADDLDSAENICDKELDAEIPNASHYKLFMKNSGLKSDLSMAFAEWTNKSKGIVSDDYLMFVTRENTKTWQASVEEIEASDTTGLDEAGSDFGLERNGMDNETYRKVIIDRLNAELRLPPETDVEFDQGKAYFYLDADSKANFRCVRRLAAL